MSDIESDSEFVEAVMQQNPTKVDTPIVKKKDSAKRLHSDFLSPTGAPGNKSVRMEDNFDNLLSNGDLSNGNSATHEDTNMDKASSASKDTNVPDISHAQVDLLEDRLAKRLSSALGELIEKKIPGIEAAVAKSVEAKVLKKVETKLDKVQNTAAYAINKTKNLQLEINYIIAITRQQQDELLQVQIDNTRKNVLFCNVPEPTRESARDSLKRVRDLISKVLPNAANIAIDSCRRQGRYDKDHPRSIVVKFFRPEDKAMVMLKKQQFGSVFLKHDYPPQIRSLHRTLGPAVEASKLTPYDGRVRVGMGILYIDDKPYKVNELMKIPWDFDISKNNRVISIIRQIYAWFGALHHFSNMFFATIVINGVEYITNEHFIQAEKARLFKDNNLLMAILKTWNPFDVKKLAKKCENFDQSLWNERATEVAMIACQAKFTTHSTLKGTLIGTYPYTLAEASLELPWGCGVALKDPKLSDTKNWKGQGIMGEVLTRIRNELIQNLPDPVDNSPSYSEAVTWSLEPQLNPVSVDNASPERSDMEVGDQNVVQD